MELMQGVVLMTGATSLVTYDLFEKSGDPKSIFAPIEEGEMNVAKFFIRDLIVGGGKKKLKFFTKHGLICEIPVANHLLDLYPNSSLTLVANEEVMCSQWLRTTCKQMQPWSNLKTTPQSKRFI